MDKMKKKISGLMLMAALLLAVGLARFIPLFNNARADVTYAAYHAANMPDKVPNVNDLINVVGAPRDPGPDNTPILFFSDIESGPNTGGQNNKGAFVTLWGKNFGSEKGSSYVTIGGGEVVDYRVWGENNAANPNLDMIVVQLGPNVQTGDIIVHTAQGDSNPLPFTVRPGSIYFVDDNSPNDPGSGTYEDPWRSPKSFYDNLAPGDICYFRAGTYGNTEYGQTGWRAVVCFTADKGGTAANPVAWVGYPGEIATFSEASSSLSFIFRWGSNTASYIIIANLTMVTSGECISNTEGRGSDNLRFVGNILTGGVYASIVSGGDDTKILGNEIKNSGSGNNQEHCIYIARSSFDFEVGWNYTHNNTLGHQIQVHTDYANRDNYVFTGSIHNNIITAAQKNDARGINIGETGDGSEIKIYNNLIYYCGGNFSGICVYSGNVSIYNNTLYDIAGTMIVLNGENSHGYDYQRSGEIRNNILYSTGSTYIGTELGASLNEMTISNNCYYGKGNGPAEDTSPTNADPQFVDLANYNFHLQSNSPCIDNGYDTSSIVTRDKDGIPRPQGSGVDIGAYEYITTELTIVSTSLPDGTVGSSYSSTLQATGGTLPYTWSITSGSLPNGLSLNSSTGNISGTPTTAGTSNFTVQVTDAGSSTATKGFTIIVSSPANNPPVLAPIGNKTVDEGQLLQFTIPATDPDGDNLTYLVNNMPTGATFTDRTFSWTPTYSQSGSYNVTFSVDDGKGGSDSEDITITVNNVNRPPVLSPIADITVNEGGTVVITPSATDPDGDNLSYTYSGWMTSSTYTTTYDDAGVHTVTVTVSDGSLTDSKSLTVTVNNVNRAPVLGSIGNKSVAEGAILSFGVTASDPDNDPVTITAAPLENWMSFNGTTFTANPGTGDTGNYSVTFTASDGNLIDTETVTISVGDVNQPPVLEPIGDKTVAGGSSLTFTISATDPDNDPLTYSAANLPTGATFTGQTFSWTPTYGQAGSYQVTFSVADDNSGTDSEEITVTVIGEDVTSPATVNDLSASTGANEGEVALSWTAPGDDGNVGTATRYIVRCSSSAIDTDTKFDGAIDTAGEPTPGAAGTSEVMTVTGLTPGQTYYFAIKTQDEVPNTSGLSNSPSAEAKGPTAPSYTIGVGFGNAAVTVLEIRVMRAVENPRITLQETAERPAETAMDASGTTYRYLKITKENFDDNDISSVTTTFKVEKSWIEDEEIDENTITLESYSAENDQWVSLPTTRVKEDDIYVYYSATSSGLPIFAVTGETPASGEGGAETLLVLGVSVMVILAIVFVLYRFRFKKSFAWKKISDWGPEHR